MKYKVWLARTFVFAVNVDAPNPRLAKKWALDDWEVPGQTGQNMDEELWTMQRGIADGSIEPVGVTVESWGVSRPV